LAKCVAELAKLSLAHGLSSNSRTHVFIFFLELMGEDDIHLNHFKKKNNNMELSSYGTQKNLTLTRNLNIPEFKYVF
jgi:hypothetical protein